MTYKLALDDDERREAEQARAEIRAHKPAQSFKQRNKARLAELAAFRSRAIMQEVTATPRGNVAPLTGVSIQRDKKLTWRSVAWTKPDGTQAYGKVLTRGVKVTVTSR